MVLKNLSLDQDSIDFIIESLNSHINALKLELEDYLDFTPEKEEVQDDIQRANDLIALLMET